MRNLALALGMMGLLASARPAAAESPPITDLEYHSYGGTGTPATDPAAAAADTAAVRFEVPPGAFLVGISLWFGDLGSAQSVDVVVWDDSAGTVEPGAELMRETVTLTPANQLQTLSAFASALPEQIRIGVTRRAAAPPSVGLDTDGISAPGRNFIKRGTAGWQTSEAAGLTGDWILGVTYSGGGGPGPLADGPGMLDDAGTTDGGSDVGTDDDATMMDDDTGCCSSGSGPSSSLLALGVLGLVLARRRAVTGA